MQTWGKKFRAGNKFGISGLGGIWGWRRGGRGLDKGVGFAKLAGLVDGGWRSGSGEAVEKGVCRCQSAFCEQGMVCPVIGIFSILYSSSGFDQGTWQIDFDQRPFRTNVRI
jgi:hypothetical protein